MKKTFKIMLFRMWAAGAVCFFGAWGRGGLAGSAEDAIQSVAQSFSLNLIAGLIGIMIICDIIIVNPVIRMASGQRILGEERSGIMMVISLPLQIIKVAAIMIIIVYTYYFLNVFFIRIFNLDENYVPVPLEPILFGILYGLYWLLFEVIINFLRRKYEKRFY